MALTGPRRGRNRGKSGKVPGESRRAQGPGGAGKTVENRGFEGKAAGGFWTRQRLAVCAHG